MTLQQLSSTVSSESSICQTRIASRDAIVVDNGSLRLTVIPELGGKIVSLIRSESGYEYLLQPPDPERAYRPCNYADRFEEYEPSGFDESYLQLRPAHIQKSLFPPNADCPIME